MGASITTRWTGEGNKGHGRKKEIGRFKVPLERGIDNVHKFLCKGNTNSVV